MARAGIHPEYHTINVVMTDGTKYQTRSTYGKEGDTITLDVDPKTHPAWVGGVHLKKTGRLESFNTRFGAMAFKADAAKDAAKFVAPKKKTAKVVEKIAPAAKDNKLEKQAALPPKGGKKDAGAKAEKPAAKTEKPAAREEKKDDAKA